MADSKQLGITCQNKTDPLVDYKIVINRLDKIIGESKNTNLLILSLDAKEKLNKIVEILENK